MNKIEKQKSTNKKGAGKRELIISALALFLVMIISGLVLWTYNPTNSPESQSSLFDSLISSEARDPLTGEKIKKVLETLPQVFGVMVENSADAWPLVGLDRAFLVIEAPVEGGIPRFIAFYSEEVKAEKIGPVRSARVYYVDWNDGFNAVYAHVGGSPEALNLIKNVYDTIDLNQFWQSEYFYRQNGARFAPHNVYTSSKLLVSALSELTFGEPVYDVWLFQDGIGVDKPHFGVSIDFAEGSTYDVIWEYQKETNEYLRYQDKIVMKLEDEASIFADNVVVMATDMRVVDNEGRLKMTTIGEGDALIIQNGETFLGRWKQASRDSRLTFYTNDDFEISMNVGATWVEVVSSLSQVSVENGY